jgi:hypothetical protein
LAIAALPHVQLPELHIANSIIGLALDWWSHLFALHKDLDLHVSMGSATFWFLKL